MGCEVGSVTLREEHSLRVFDSGVLRKEFILQKMDDRTLKLNYYDLAKFH